MIDLKKPLEGVPGLLLMAALIFFGATIGIGVALVFTWIPMSDALANFLGGVVGAGLGAALAVMGAVYVQRKEARDRRAVPINRLQSALFRIDMLFASMILHLGERPHEQIDDASEREARRLAIIRLHQDIVEAVGELPDGAELPRTVHNTLVTLRRALPKLVKPASDYAAYQPPKGGTPEAFHLALLDVRGAAMTVSDLRRMVDAL